MSWRDRIAGYRIWKARTVMGGLILLLLAASPRLHASASLLLAEPYGGFGGFNPTGHAAVYLDRVCAVSPTKLRLCNPGEQGVVISRYYKIAGYDWLAVPLIPYLYSVTDASEVRESVDTTEVEQLRDAYRREHLLELVPDTEAGMAPTGEWYQLVGAAYDRKIYVFEIETTIERDQAFIDEFNSRENDSHFNLLYRNCADFSRDVINFYYPKALRRSIVADLGITTPKHVAKSFVRYSKKHPELKFRAYVIPQVPGNRPPSTATRGVLESLVRSKKYAVPLVLLNVWLTPAFAAGYVTTGRFNPDKYAATAYGPMELEREALLANQRPHPENTIPEASLELSLSQPKSPNAALVIGSAEPPAGDGGMI